MTQVSEMQSYMECIDVYKQRLPSTLCRTMSLSLSLSPTVSLLSDLLDIYFFPNLFISL